MDAITILGSTGTIGVNTLDVIRCNPDRFSVVALTANRNVEGLLAQCREWRPSYAVMRDEPAAERLRAAVVSCGLETEVLAGTSGLEHVAALPEVDQVMAGIVGAAGLLPTLCAAKAGKRVLLANKESLVMSGQLFMDAIGENGAELIPIDSEHNAIFQCLPAPSPDRAPDGARMSGVTRILLTGSGGPFRTTPVAELGSVTPEQACAHPNWVMGRKISVDSATMMNKGLEVIEACWLFATSVDSVEVVIHPQSVIHSMVEYQDGSVVAQLGNPDMRTPIAHALAWPDRMGSGVASLHFPTLGQLDFAAPDFERVPCLRLGFEAARAGGTTPTILNAANEVAVDSFLNLRVRFTDIPRIIEGTLGDCTAERADSIETILGADSQARMIAHQYVAALGERG